MCIRDRPITRYTSVNFEKDLLQNCERQWGQSASSATLYCDENQRKNAIPQASRLCVRTLREALQRVELRSNSTVFLATDSDAIVESVADVRREWPALRIYHLSLTRAKYDSQTRIERRVHSDRAQILSEALLDMAFLSLSRRIVGAMIGNLPRLALQLRVRRTYNYTALDSRAWCTRTACKLPAYRVSDGV